jgi:FemAB-related protein (PEP-CTERM system-associated)
MSRELSGETLMSQERRSSVSVRLLTPGDERKWDQYVFDVRDSSAYHAAGWKRVIEKSFGHKTYYLLSEDEGGNVRGILPLVHMKSLMFGNFIVSMPYFNYGGICTQHIESYRALLEEAIRIARRERAEHIEFREERIIENGLPFKTSKVSMRLELPSSADDLWKSFPSKLRSQIRRPERDGLYVDVGREDRLDAFTYVFAMNMRDLGTPVYTKDFFRNILETFPQSTWICTVYKEKEPIASGILLGFKDCLEIPWASSIRKYNSLSPNMLLYWSVLQYACQHGYRVFDFGRSTPGEGTYNFKGQWGAKPAPLYWYYWTRRRDSLPELNPKNPKYRTAIEIWKRLPVPLTKILGPYISKNLP